MYISLASCSPASYMDSITVKSVNKDYNRVEWQQRLYQGRVATKTITGKRGNKYATTGMSGKKTTTGRVATRTLSQGRESTKNSITGKR